MCIACEWAPHFSSLSTKATRRTALRAAAAVALGAGAVAACSTGTDSSSATGGANSDSIEADFVFRNGRVYTVSEHQEWAEAVAVKGNTIRHVGGEAGAMAMVGPSTRVIDLGGKLLMPGFVEGHIHPFFGAFLSSGVNLQVSTKQEALAAIAKYAKENPDGPIRGFGWRIDMFGPEGPTRQELDSVLKDRPGFFFAVDAHSMWANSKALELAGVHRDTPDPVPGFSYYAKDSKGEPSGYILEISAMLDLIDAIEPVTAESMQRALEDWLPKAAAAGITSVFDAGVPPVGIQAALLGLYNDIERRGALPFRVVASYVVKAPPVDDAVAMFTQTRDEIASDLVQVGMIKIMGDGTQGGYTAWLLDPYADKPDSIGTSPFTEQQWGQLVGQIDSAGIDMHVHACGERTVRVALDAFEAAIAKNPARDRRHSIAHLIYVDDADNARFARLGVGAQFSANWFSADPDTVVNLATRYGAPRKDNFYRIQDILRAGGRVSLGTDWPAAGYFSTYKPLESIQIGVTRQLVGDPNVEVLGPTAQKLSAAQAVHANTLGAAHQIRMENKVGSVEVGKLADLIVLDRNILEGDPHDIHEAAVTMTMMNGQIRHEITR
ncbi:putative amidohydrolase [Mycobacteroides stephanolepidis]|uniref:Putative amidohydrolase n=1 Tax=[Mycobacterium] stephanolepidis TaxID=1520670 RepID=A0A1Z4EXT7_9MYCO|nr:amidohydrolase [[Mycobacterium] stephanolepidis]BAX97764.1 putative amidohydrolase [[Mycobacterium] stephanolepidis]